MSSLVLLAALGGLAPLTARAATTFDVTKAPYNADKTGVKDSGKAIQAAINDAEAGPGNTVYFPAGQYALLQQVGGVNSLVVTGGSPITLLGDGPSASMIVEHIGKNALDVQTDGTVVNGLELDTQTFDQRSALVMAASSTTLENSTILGGTNTFALYYPGPATATKANPVYDTGNQLNNVTINDRWTLDGFSFSYQANGLIQNIDHTGSRMALFVNKNVEVDSYHYHPGTQAGGTQGFWITQPSDGITINDFVTDGNGGTLGANTSTTGSHYSTNITINREVFLQPGFHLSIGEVRGLTINGCNFGTNSTLRFIDNVQASGVLVENCTSLPVVRFTQPSTGVVQAEFDNNTYPAFTPVPQEGSQTFLNGSGGPTDFTVNGGTFQNCTGGLFHGPATTFAVSGLSGYPCDADSAPAAALNVTQSPTVQLGVNADASSSTDSDATPIAWYQFNWGDGTVTARQSSSMLSHTYATPGSYTVTVTVGDSAGLFSTASQQITVSADQAPIAALTVTPSSGSEQLAVNADASQSTDTDSTPIASYTFDFGDGTVVGPQPGATAGHTFTTIGQFTVTVTVTDTAGLHSSTSQLVAVSAPNLVGNPGFETDTSGWLSTSGNTLSRSSTAHSGSFSAQVTRKTKTGRVQMGDSPYWNTNTTAGTTCTVSAWVEVPAGIKVYARTIELSGTSTVSTHNKNVLSSGTWVQLTVVAPIVNGGDSLNISFHATLAVGQAMLIDDVSETCQ